MFHDQLRRAVEASPRVALTKVSALLWKACAAGQVSEAEAAALSEAIELRRALPAIQKRVQPRLPEAAPGPVPPPARGPLPPWSDAAAGPPLALCRHRSLRASRWPSRPC